MPHEPGHGGGRVPNQTLSAADRQRMLGWDSSKRHAEDPTFGEKVKAMLDYGFAPLDSKEKMEAVLRWSANPNAKMEDMPPGAMNVELPAGFVPFVGGAQALRDIYRDIKNRDVSGWTLLDAASLIPGIAMLGSMVGMVKHADMFGDMGRAWSKIEKLRGEGLQGEALLKRAISDGIPEDQARRMVGLGKESADEVIGTAKPGETVIGARGVDAEVADVDAMLKGPEAMHYKAKRLIEDFGYSPEEAFQQMRAAGWTDDAARAAVNNSGAGHVSQRMADPADADKAFRLQQDYANRARKMMEDHGIPPQRSGAEPAHWEDIRRAAGGEEGIDLDRMGEIQRGMDARTSGPGYDMVALSPQYVHARVSGNGADAFKKAYTDAIEVSDVDVAIAAKHNKLIDEAAGKLEGRYDIGSTSDASKGLDPEQQYIVSPSKGWETSIEAPDGRITPQQVAAFRAAHADDLKSGFVGTWYNPDTGAVVFDVSKGTDDLSVAQSMARKGEQDGLFDFKNKEFIETAPEGAPSATFARPERVVNNTPITEGETVQSVAAKIAGLSLMKDTSIDDAFDWAVEALGPGVADYVDDLLPRVERLRTKWETKLGSDVDSRLMEHFEKGSEFFADDWYETILPTANEVFGEELGPIWARIYAYTSAGADAGGSNITYANKGISQVALGQPIETGRFPTRAGPMIQRALTDMDSPVPVKHVGSKAGIDNAKLKEFDDNISFGGDRAIIDMWQSRLAQDVLNRHGKTAKFDDPTAEGYQVIQSLTEGIARREGQTNRGFQAGTWAGTKADWGELGSGGLETGGDLIRQHPGVRTMLPDEKTGMMLPSFIEKGKPVTYRQKYGIPGLLAPLAAPGLMRAQRRDEDERPSLFRGVSL